MIFLINKKDYGLLTLPSILLNINISRYLHRTLLYHVIYLILAYVNTGCII